MQLAQEASTGILALFLLKTDEEIIKILKIL